MGGVDESAGRPHRIEWASDVRLPGLVGSMINQYGFEIGVLGEGFPFVRVGKYGPPIVVLPGLSLDYRPPSWLVMSSYALGFHRLSSARTVYVVQRRKGLPAATSLRDLADEYAELIRREWGQADLMGFFSGGAIAQHVALDHPESVQSLILLISGAKLGLTGRDTCLRWLGLVQAGQWAQLREELLRSACDGDVSGRRTEASSRPPGEARPADPVDAQDFVTVLTALLSEDTSLRLPFLSTPTLIIGGDRDSFYPAGALREMAGAIPQATLLIRSERDHGFAKQRAGELQDDVINFLLRRTRRSNHPTLRNRP